MQGVSLMLVSAEGFSNLDCVSKSWPGAAGSNEGWHNYSGPLY